MIRNSFNILVILIATTVFAAGCSKDDKDKKTDDKAQKGDMKKGDMKEGDNAGGMAKTVDINVDGEGFHPGTVNAKAGDHLDLVFTRTSDQGCGTEVVIASTKEEYDLPLNKPVKVAFHAEKAGTVGFSCGMGMLKGSIVVE